MIFSFKNKLFILILFFISHSLTCQEIENISTERPDQGEGTFIVPLGKLQIENGIYAENSVQLNNFFLRCGIGAKSEFRIAVDAGKTSGRSGVLPIGISIKRSLCEQHSWIPATTLVGYYYFGSVASKILKRHSDNYSISIAFQNEINKKWGLSYNLGTTELRKNLVYTLSVSFSPIRKINLFTEIFGRFYSVTQPVHGFDCGILYFIRPNMQLDLAGGLPIGNKEIPRYLTLGYSLIFSY